MADLLEVSVRTIYRDMADLQASGVPIEGEAGVGYMLRRGSQIPPLMFSASELQALVVGARFVRAFAGSQMATAAGSAMRKIEAVLPPELRRRERHTRIFAPVWNDHYQQQHDALLDRLHAAIEQRQVLSISYLDLADRSTQRNIEPLCLAFWGAKWTLGSWCRLRRDFRNFRLDRIGVYEETGERFGDLPERGLQAYLRSVRAASRCQPDL